MSRCGSLLMPKISAEQRDAKARNLTTGTPDCCARDGGNISATAAENTCSGVMVTYDLKHMR
jgi:hypothetical protein